MKLLLYLQKKINNVKLHIDGNTLEYSNRYIHYRVDKGECTRMEWTCSGYRVCFANGDRKTYRLTLLNKEEQESVDSFFNNVRKEK